MNNKKPLNGPSFESTDNPEKLVFLLHGYGDNGENFIPLAKYLYNPKFNINFFAPNAPSIVPQYPLGRQWFNLYPNGVNFNKAGPKEKEMLKQDCFSSLDLINNYIKNLCSKYKLTFKDCFIIGFSQGAMMTFEFGRYIDNLFAGCVLLSGRIIPSENYGKKYFVKTPIMIIHGDKDNVMEPKYFFEACKILQNQGFLFESHLIKGERHNISPVILKFTQDFIQKNI